MSTLEMPSCSDLHLLVINHVSEEAFESLSDQNFMGVAKPESLAQATAKFLTHKNHEK